MIEHYSTRALQVVFAARFKAGERGSDALDVGDLVAALVVEDQGRMDDLIKLPEGAVVAGLDSHPPFIEPEEAARLLRRLENVLTHSTAVPPSVDLPLTVRSQAVFEFAEELRKELGHERIEPLHLMAGILQEESGFSNELQAVGITQDFVLAKLREGAK